MRDRPQLSVVVPAYQGATLLPITLTALRASDLPRDAWELIVVDDASTDETAAVAERYADRVVRLSGKPHGPGYARNRGVEVCSGDWVMFVDADVRVHADTLSCVVRATASKPPVDAVFGAYDEAPPEPDFLSQYRNLLHRYVHVRGAGEADTFWAGCGAVRRSAFLAVRGFDEQRYPRPQIEDIELGYRLRDGGGRIVIDPSIEGAHLKRWRLVPSIKTDLFDRGVPWVRLLLERKHLNQSSNLNLQRGERLKTVLVCAGLAAVVAGLAIGKTAVVSAGAVAVIGVVASNWRILRWFAEKRNAWFALRVAPMNVLYYVLSGVSVALGLVLHITSRRSTFTS